MERIIVALCLFVVFSVAVLGVMSYVVFAG